MDSYDYIIMSAGWPPTGGWRARPARVHLGARGMAEPVGDTNSRRLR